MTESLKTPLTYLISETSTVVQATSVVKEVAEEEIEDGDKVSKSSADPLVKTGNFMKKAEEAVEGEEEKYIPAPDVLQPSSSPEPTSNPSQSSVSALDVPSVSALDVPLVSALDLPSQSSVSAPGSPQPSPTSEPLSNPRSSKTTEKWNIGQLTVLILVLYDWLHPSAGIRTKLKHCYYY